jgi:AraC family transcriptional regulator
MIPVIQIVLPKKLLGKHMQMSLAENKTPELWRSFMPLRKEIKNKLSSDLFSLQVYPPSFDFKNFNPNASFEKWALVEVTDFNTIPEGMEAFTLEGGRYAVFNYKGPASDGERIFRYIFETWLPASAYELDQRPHFEVLGKKYKNDEADSEEEIWVPVKPKGQD